MSQEVNNKNTKLARHLGLIAVAMFGFGYALVPIYDTLCEWKWIERDRPDAIKQQQETGYQIDTNRRINVEFMTTLNANTPMEFSAQSKQINAYPGQYYTVNFYAKNNTDKPLKARAIASFSPASTSRYFEKTQCFCFEEQTFNAHEQKTMPMRFVINPQLPQEYKTITLSYTFFDNTEKSAK